MVIAWNHYFITACDFVILAFLCLYYLCYWEDDSEMLWS